MNTTCLALSSLLGLTLIACGGDSGPDCASVTDTPSINLGTGESTFLALSPGDTLEMIAGPQGGFHVYAALQTTGFYPGDSGEIDTFESGGAAAFANSPTASYEVSTAAKELGTKAWKLPLPGNGREGDVVVLDGIASLEEAMALDGTPGTIAVTLADECGVEQSTSVDVMFALITPE